MKIFLNHKIQEYTGTPPGQITLTLPDILSVCKAEEGGDAVASLTGNNAADGKTGGAKV